MIGISSTGRPTTEALEAAQFGDLEIGVGDLALVVQEDLDLAVAFQAGDRVNCDALHALSSSSRSGLLAVQQRACQVEAVERARRDRGCRPGCARSPPGRCCRSPRPPRSSGALRNREPHRPGRSSPTQGAPAVGQRASQPLRVAGPLHRMPCSSRHSAGSGRKSWMRVNPLMRFSLRVRVHSSQTVEWPAPITEPAGGSVASPLSTLMTSSTTAAIWCDSGGQPGM